MAVFAKIVYTIAIAHLFPEDIMQDSSVYQDITQKARAEGIQQGIELGQKAFAIESILDLLEERFQTRATLIKSALEAIDDLQRLKHLYRAAAETQTLEAFIEKL